MSQGTSRRTWLRRAAVCLLSPLLATLFTPFPCGPVRAEDQREQPPKPPYPPSEVIRGLEWHWETRQTAAPGSDLWPVTWAADDHLCAAWGDGGGFGGTDQEGRVAAGFARLEGPPENVIGVNVNGGKEPLDSAGPARSAWHPASFSKQGKVGGLLAVGDTAGHTAGERLYGWLNTQEGKWPNVDEALIWSDDHGATWERSRWAFPHGDGNLKPSTFLNFGKGYTGVPDRLQGHVYFYGQKQGREKDTYLGRAPVDKVTDRASYEFLESPGTSAGRDGKEPDWSPDVGRAKPVFSDARPTGDLVSVVYVPALKRYLLTCFHKGPGELGVFDAPQPWGPWTTVAYYDHWGEMGGEGKGLTCSFPAKWMSPDGRMLWCVFSAYGDGAKQGIDAHDKFNLVKVTLKLNEK